MAYLKSLSTFGGEYIYDLAFVNGTKTVFMQASAPTGWTRLTTVNDAALRIVDGNSGVRIGAGTVSFSTIFNSSVAINGTINTAAVSGTLIETTNSSITPTASVAVGAHTLTTTEMPVHSHSTSDRGHYHWLTDQY